MPVSKRERLRLDLLAKYTKMLDNASNCDIEPWTCKVCGWGPVTRLFAAVDHALAHIRRDELEPIKRPAKESVEPGRRPMDLD